MIYGCNYSPWEWAQEALVEEGQSETGERREPTQTHLNDNVTFVGGCCSVPWAFGRLCAPWFRVVLPKRGGSGGVSSHSHPSLVD